MRPLLSNVVVLPAFRRRGIASRLVASAEDLARDWEFDELLLLVNEENEAARTLYSRLGYVEEDTRDSERRTPRVFGLQWTRCKVVAMRRQLVEGGWDGAVLDVAT